MHYRTIKDYLMSYLLPLVVLFACLALPVAARAATLTVTSIADDGSAGTLRSTIAAANNGDTIVFNVPTNSTITLAASKGPLNIDNIITITGPAGGVAISGDNQCEVFSIVGGSPNFPVNISDLTIENGSDINGGGVYVSGAVTLTHCTLTDNYGAGLENGGTATLINCTLTANNGGGAGGGVYNYNAGTVTLAGCTLTDNEGAAYGGAVYNDYDCTATLTNCTLNGNVAEGGGGILNHGSVRVTDCTITGNTGSSYGGGIASNGPATITNCTITANTSATGAGGALYNDTQLATLTNDILWADSGGEIDINSGSVNANHSDIDMPTQVTFSGTGNINSDPTFVHSANLTGTTPDYGDLHLWEQAPYTSPCIDTGTSTGAPTTDINGYPWGNSVSMGAYSPILLDVTAPPSATVGAAINLGVTAVTYDQSTTVTGYQGTAHFTSTDAAATLPADAALTDGTGSFPATLYTHGSQTITATDAVEPTFTGTSNAVDVSQTLKSITVSPAGSLQLSLPSTQQFTAVEQDTNGFPMLPPLPLTWSLVAPSVGSISATGGLYHTGTIPGTATVEAKSGGIVSNMAAVTVTAPAVTVATSASATPNPVTGTTTKCSVLGGYAGTGGAGVLTCAWSSTGPAAVTFSPNGTTAAKNTTATFTQAGSYTLTATITAPDSQSATSSVDVTVNATPASIAITPGTTLTISPPLPQSQQFTATANDQFGNSLSPQPTISWSLGTGSVGSITTDGLYHSGKVAGTTFVKAKSGAISGTVTVLVNPPPTVATPASATPNLVTGTTTSLSVLGAYGGTGGAAGLTYTWSAAGPAAVTYSDNGDTTAQTSTATFTQAGSYTFTVTIANPFGGTVTSSIGVTVNQTFTSITVTPGPTLSINPPLPVTQQFAATANDQFSNALSAQPAITWSLASGSVGSISNAGGLYHSGKIAGSATVKATSGAVSGTCAVTVN